MVTRYSELYVWGSQSQGELLTLNGERGSGLCKPIQTDPILIDLNNIIIEQICLGNSRSLILTKSGAVYHWGRIYGQTVDDNIHYQPKMILWCDINWRPTKLSIELKVLNIYAANDYCILQTVNNELYSFGSNKYGELGLGDETITNSAMPKNIVFPVNIKSIVDISLGKHHCLVVVRHDSNDDDETHVYGFGQHCHGALGMMQAAFHRRNVESPTLIQDLEDRNCMKVACGDKHSMFLTHNQRIYVVGTISNGCLVWMPTRLTQVEAMDMHVEGIYAGESFTIFHDINNRIHAFPPHNMEVSISTFNELEAETIELSYIHNVLGQRVEASQFTHVYTSPTSKKYSVITQDDGHILFKSYGEHNDPKCIMWQKYDSQIDIRNGNVEIAIGSTHFAIVLKEFKAPVFRKLCPVYANSRNYDLESLDIEEEKEPPLHSDVNIIMSNVSYDVHSVFMNTRLGTLQLEDLRQFGAIITYKNKKRRRPTHYKLRSPSSLSSSSKLIQAYSSSSSSLYDDDATIISIPDLSIVYDSSSMFAAFECLLEWVYTNEIQRLSSNLLPFLLSISKEYSIDTLYEALVSVSQDDSVGNDYIHIQGQCSNDGILNLDLMKAVENQLYLYGTDVIFDVNGTYFHAHKCILSSRLVYFANMFRHGRESVDKIIPFPSVSAATFRAFLVWCYCDVLTTSVVLLNLEELFVLSDLVAARDLKRQCQEVVFRRLFHETFPNYCVHDSKKQLEDNKRHRKRSVILPPLTDTISRHHVADVLHVDFSEKTRKQTIYWLIVCEKFHANRLKNLLLTSAFGDINYKISDFEFIYNNNDEKKEFAVDESLKPWVPSMMESLCLQECNASIAERLISLTSVEKTVVMKRDFETMEVAYKHVILFNAIRVVALMVATILCIWNFSVDDEHHIKWLVVGVVFSIAAISTTIMFTAHITHMLHFTEYYWKFSICQKKQHILGSRVEILNTLYVATTALNSSNLIRDRVEREKAAVINTTNVLKHEAENLENDIDVPTSDVIRWIELTARGLSLVCFAITLTYYLDYRNEISWLHCWLPIMVANGFVLCLLLHDAYFFLKRGLWRFNNSNNHATWKMKLTVYLLLGLNFLVNIFFTPSALFVWQTFMLFLKTMEYVSIDYWYVFIFLLTAIAGVWFVVFILDITLLVVSLAMAILPEFRENVRAFLRTRVHDRLRMDILAASLALINILVVLSFITLKLLIEALETSDNVRNADKIELATYILCFECTYFIAIFWLAKLRRQIWLLYYHVWRRRV